MEEYRRFFRYVLPGLIFAIELSIFVFLSDIEELQRTINFILYHNKISEIIGIGTSIVAFLATGGLGYIFGSIYHVSFHIIRNKGTRYVGVDHRSAVVNAASNNWIALKKIENDDYDVDSKQITPSGAWRIITSYWNERVETSQIIKSAEPRSKSLADILHGTGTSFIAASVAIFTWIFILLYYHSLPNIISIAVVVITLLIHAFNYAFVVKDYQGVINTNAVHAMRDFASANKCPDIILVSTSDYK